MNIKKTMKIVAIVLLCSLALVAAKEIQLSKVDDLRLKFLQLQYNLWDYVYNFRGNLISETKPELELIKKFKDFGDVLQKEYPNNLTYGLNSIENVKVWAKTHSELRGVYVLYESFRRFQNMQTTPDRVLSPDQEWIDLTQKLLQSGKYSVEQAQNSIADFIVNENLYDEVLKATEGEMLCNANQSPQQILYNLYTTIELTKLKGYMMMQFSYMLLKLLNKDSVYKKADSIKDRYKYTTMKSIEHAKKTMKNSSRDLWKCDPKTHVAGETYIEVTQLLQGYVQNEVDLNPKGTCSETCSEYTYTKSHSCFQNLYCSKQRQCKGNIINCIYIDSVMWVCPANASSGRRYEYVEYKNGSLLGRKEGCCKDIVKVDSWWRWFYRCSYCFCLCDAQGVYSDRYFNMRSVVADIQNNRVVTGLRFVKNNRIVHLQIQEGQLLSQGKIDQSTVHWVPVEDYKIIDRYIHNGQDYHTLSWEKRSIDLDDLTTDDEHILTGVRFKKIDTHLHFEIYMTPFDFNTGKLINPEHKSKWKDNSAVTLRTPLDLKNPDVPTRLPTPSRPDSKSDQYVDMTHTDIFSDAAQATVPFLDAQPVVSSVPVPLSGAGIYHKGGKNSGGFIAPKIIMYDFSRHLKVEFS